MSALHPSVPTRRVGELDHLIVKKARSKCFLAVSIRHGAFHGMSEKINPA